MISKLSFFLIGIFLVVFTIGVIQAHGDDTVRITSYAWTPTDGYFKVYSVLNDNLPNTAPCAHGYTGCHFTDQGVHLVHIPGDPWEYVPAGCNRYTHEQLHAWGYNEEMISDFFNCDPEVQTKYNSLPHVGFWK